MEISKTEFTQRWLEEADKSIEWLAYHPDVKPDKFYTMTCMLENMAFFAPVIYDMLKPTPLKNEQAD